MSEKDNSYRPGTPDFSQVLSRRRFIKQSALAAGAVGLGLSLPSFGSSAEAADIARFAGEVDFSLAIEPPKDRRDERLKNFKIPLIRVDDSMLSNPSGFPVEAIDFNPRFTEWEAKNRLGLAVADALTYAHSIAEENIDPIDFNYDKLQGLLNSGTIPKKPNASEYILRIQSDEELSIPFMAIPTHHPVDSAELQVMKADLRESVKFNFTSDPNQMFYFQGGKDNDGNKVKMDGYTVRVNSRNGLELDIYANMELFGTMFPDIQESYDLTLAYMLRRALSMSAMTLGIVKQDGISLAQSHFIPKYADIQENGELFPDQYKIIIGNYEDTATGAPEDILIHTKFPSK